MLRPNTVIGLIGLALTTLVFTTPTHAEERDLWLQRLPAGGVRFATQVYSSSDNAKHRFIIAEVSHTGMSLLAEENHADFQSFHWKDSRTLVALGDVNSSGQPFVQVYVDGKPSGARIAIPKASWELSPNQELGVLFDLLIDKKQNYWVGTCLAYDDNRPNTCKAYRALRADLATGSFDRLTRKVPPGSKDTRHLQSGLAPNKLGRLSAPAGYKVKLHKTDITDGSSMMGDGKNVPAFTCTGPTNSATWPSADVTNWEFLTRPKTIRWARHEPPIFIAEGPATNPIAETGPSHRVFRACSPQAMDDAVFGPHDLWFELAYEVADMIVTGAHWVVNVGPIALGQVPGSDLIAIAPE
jgi:hypothetical protein